MTTTTAIATPASVEFDFTALCSEPVDAAVAIRDTTGVHVGAIVLLDGAPATSGATVTQRLQGGFIGSVYELTCQVTDENGRTQRITQSISVEHQQETQ